MAELSLSRFSTQELTDAGLRLQDLHDSLVAENPTTPRLLYEVSYIVLVELMIRRFGSDRGGLIRALSEGSRL